MRPTKTFDQEKVQFNLAKLKTHGQHFEIVIDPDKVIEYKDKKLEDVLDVVRAEHVFADAKKGEIVSDDELLRVFGTDKFTDVVKKILSEGEIQFTQEYREKLRSEKIRKIINIIQINAVDPKTKLPHPAARLENAFQQAKVHIDDFKRAEDQVQDVVKKLQSILPLKFDTKVIQVIIPAAYAAKMYSTVTSYGRMRKDQWMSDGSWLVHVEIPAGLQNEFFDKLNGATHGEVDIQLVD